MQLGSLTVHLASMSKEAMDAADIPADERPAPDEVDEEFFTPVVFWAGDDSGPPTFTMSEEVLSTLLQMIPGYKDYTFVPDREVE